MLKHCVPTLMDPMCVAAREDTRETVEIVQMLMNAPVLTQTIAMLMRRVITLKGLTPVAALMDSRVTAKPAQTLMNAAVTYLTSATPTPCAPTRRVSTSAAV